MKLASLRRTLRTIRYLIPLQAYHYARQRGLGATAVLKAQGAELRCSAGPGAWIRGSGGSLGLYDFRFLNTKRTFLEGRVDWSPPDVSRLWRYNLHYFDYLHDDRPDSAKQALIEDWIKHNPQGSQPAWEPYTASLRIANWVKYFFCNPDAIAGVRVASLFTQARWLRKNLERHILANHFFENIKALVFAGTFFTGKEADAWLKFASKELSVQLHEQTLPDGCHYERTPAYHCLMLQNYLELYALMQANSSLFSGSLIDQLRVTAQRGLDFLADILLPGQVIPLFNDSAYNSAPAPKAIFAYAHQLGLGVKQVDSSRIVNKADAGLYGYVSGQDALILDCGDIGPAYQPGHTHCDFLSYELIFDGQPVVVDSGVYEYEPGAMRHYVRSTMAHNTVVVDGDEQSEIWGEFRVARRARKLAADITEVDGSLQFEGAFRGFYGVSGRVVHRRRVDIAPWDESEKPKKLVFTDCLEGRGSHKAESYMHLHPDVEALDQGEGRILLRCAGREIALITIGAGLDYGIGSSLYCPEFGKKIENTVVIVSASGLFPLQMSYTIKKFA